MCHLEIGSLVHRSTAVARSTHKRFTDTPAVQFLRVGPAIVVTQPSGRRLEAALFSSTVKADLLLRKLPKLTVDSGAKEAWGC